MCSDSHGMTRTAHDTSETTHVRCFAPFVHEMLGDEAKKHSTNVSMPRMTQILDELEKITAGTKQNPTGQQVQSLSLVMNQAWSKCKTDFAEVLNSNRVFLHASHLISSWSSPPLDVLF